MADFMIKQNDLLPEISGVCVGDSGNPVNLTTATGVEFHMAPAAGGAAKVNAAGVIVDAANGVVKYSWTGTDTDTAGEFVAEFEVMFPSSKQMTFPNDANMSISITDDIA